MYVPKFITYLTGIVNTFQMDVSNIKKQRPSNDTVEVFLAFSFSCFEEEIHYLFLSNVILKIMEFLFQPLAKLFMFHCVCQLHEIIG